MGRLEIAGEIYTHQRDGLEDETIIYLRPLSTPYADLAQDFSAACNLLKPVFSSFCTPSPVKERVPPKVATATAGGGVRLIRLRFGHRFFRFGLLNPQRQFQKIMRDRRGDRAAMSAVLH